MTAFATAEKTKDVLWVAVEIRSYNSRFLDIALRLPPAYLFMEERIKGLIAKRVTRGRVEIRIQIRDDSDGVFTFEVNKPKARAYHEALVQLKNEFDINAQLSVDFLMGAGGVVKPAEINRDSLVFKVDPQYATLDLPEEKEVFIKNEANKIMDFLEKTLDQINKEIQEFNNSLKLLASTEIERRKAEEQKKDDLTNRLKP